MMVRQLPQGRADVEPDLSGVHRVGCRGQATGPARHVRPSCPARPTPGEQYFKGGFLTGLELPSLRVYESR